MLEEPLPWDVDSAPSEEQIEREGAEFMAFMAQHSQMSGG